MQLITIPFSHFCEKGRWAMDRSGLPYRELRCAPVIQRLVVMPLGSLTVPVLVDGRRVVRGSNDILRRSDRELPEQERAFPADPQLEREVDELVARFDDVVAPNVRRWFYSWATAEPERLREYGSHGLASFQSSIMRGALPVIAGALTNHFAIDGSTRQETAEIVEGEFAFVSDLLADGREYLVGDRFTAADLAFAAFVGAAIGAPGYGGKGYSPPGRPGELQEQASAWAATPAGRWVHQIYARHRGVRATAPLASAAA